MKTKDIEVGGEYAWARGNRDRRHRVKVLQTGLPEHNGFNPTMNQAEIEFLDEPGWGWGALSKGGIKKVNVREIRNTWAEQIVYDQKAAEAKAQREATEQAANEHSENVAEFLKALGFNASGNTAPWADRGTTRVEVSKYDPDHVTIEFTKDDVQRLLDTLSVEAAR